MGSKCEMSMAMSGTKDKADKKDAAATATAAAAAGAGEKMRLDQLLVERGLAPSRNRAQALIMAGHVVVGEHRAEKAGQRVAVDAPLRLKGKDHPYVSRGGMKLQAALTAWNLPVRDAICLDVGASTGGFTDVLLRHGAARVYAVDVGHSQLHSSLLQDERVENLQRTHIVKMESQFLKPAPSVAVIDVSFISLERVLPATLNQLTSEAHVVALIKPQFEVGRDDVGKGGIVRDPVARQAAVEKVLECAKALGLVLLGQMPSPIQGTQGNAEFLAAWVRTAENIGEGA
jgi:23S rRNA (cytidine1920-2'-O)/16S rRNA (cytidine1409-2'-O)-methyltransferase